MQRMRDRERVRCGHADIEEGKNERERDRERERERERVREERETDREGWLNKLFIESLFSQYKHSTNVSYIINIEIFWKYCP